MRKVVKGMALLTVVSVGTSILSAKVLTIDSSKILRESREGRGILAQNEKDKKQLMDFEYGHSKKIGQLREDLEKGVRAGKLAEEAIQDKYEDIGRAQRKAKHAIDDAREDYKIKEQKRVLAFRKRVHEIAFDFFKKDGDVTSVFDKNTPGMIYVADSSDRTKELKEEIDARHEKEKATLLLTKSGTANKDKKAA